MCIFYGKYAKTSWLYCFNGIPSVWLYWVLSDSFTVKFSDSFIVNFFWFFYSKFFWVQCHHHYCLCALLIWINLTSCNVMLCTHWPREWWFRWMHGTQYTSLLFWLVCSTFSHIRLVLFNLSSGLQCITSGCFANERRSGCNLKRISTRSMAWHSHMLS